MARKRIPKRRKKCKQKVNHPTPHAPLCALGAVLTGYQLYAKWTSKRLPTEAE